MMNDEFIVGAGPCACPLIQENGMFYERKKPMTEILPNDE